MDIKDKNLEVNKRLVAKAIGELYYEENISPVKIDDQYKLELASGKKYYFKAIEGIWTSLTVDRYSIKREDNSGVHDVQSAAQFFIDAKEELCLTDIVLSNFLEEMNNTIVRDIYLLDKTATTSADDLLQMEEVERESYLNGHPKALLNKGRIGWNQEESALYSPEQSKGFKLHWLAINKKNSTYKFSSTTNEEEVLKESFNDMEFSRLNNLLADLSINKDDYLIIPTHPWQWNNIIKTQFIHELSNKEIIHLGEFGDTYRPQTSIRTLSNISRQSKLDIKVPLTILNTSAIRGLPKKYIEIGVTISDYLEDLVSGDTLLVNSNLTIIKERAGASFISPFFSQVKDAPYRYHEYLGVTWRDSMEIYNDKSQNIISLMTGNLLFVDDQGKAFITSLIEKSNIDTSSWLRSYFKYVVIPLYHLQNKYGISLVSHGQNIILKTKNYIPCGVSIKDFGGDLRIADEHIEKYKTIKGIDNISTLPAAHLIHDLYTGHMVTLLRFISGILRDTQSFKEIDFYKILSEEIEKYNTNNKPTKEINLLREKFERVIINTVRFQIGYGDSSERPVPKLGTDLKNPIFLGLQARK